MVDALATIQLVETLDDIATRAEGDQAAIVYFYRFGRQVERAQAYAEGYAQAEADMDAAWSALAEKVQRMSREPTFDELRQRREKTA